MLSSSCFSFFDTISNYILEGVYSINNYFTNKYNTYTNRYYYLSLVNDDNRGWSIHGLWPQYTQNSYPTYCRTVDFDYKKLTPILKDLETHWYSVEGSDEEFWKHEWTKHGSCMFNNCDELEYFRTALELYVTVIESDVINKFKINDKKAMIPFDLNFKLIENLTPNHHHN